MSYEYKQVIVMRTDLNMRKGKMVAQGAHASLGAILSLSNLWADACNETMYIPSPEGSIEADYEKALAIKIWLDNSFAKVCVGVKSEEELLAIYEAAKRADLLNCLITDNGATEFHGVKTNTCVGIGPAKSEEIDKITGHLKLL